LLHSGAFFPRPKRSLLRRSLIDIACSPLITRRPTSKLTLGWNASTDAVMFSLTVSYPTAWIGLGFGSSMRSTEMVICQDGTVATHYSTTTGEQPMSKQMDGFIPGKFQANATHTTCSFQISTNAAISPLCAHVHQSFSNHSIRVIYAYSPVRRLAFHGKHFLALVIPPPRHSVISTIFK
jgi:hypothetical protein